MPLGSYSVRILIGGVIFAAAVLCAISGFIVARWASLDPPVKAAIISGTFTVAAAVGGALLVVYQLNRQAAIARATNEYGEALKLKKTIYDDVRNLCDEASAQANAADQFADGFLRAVSRARSADWTIPHQNIDAFGETNTKLVSAIRALVRSSRSWTITEPRMAHFHDLFDEALSEQTVVIMEFYAASVLHYADRSVTPAHWRAPNDQEMIQLTAATERLGDFIDRLVENVAAFQSEMQTALLGELFRHRSQ